MSYAGNRYAYSSYGASILSSEMPPGQVLPPPIPGGSTVYYWSNENGDYPWAFGGWAGARPQITLVAGGVIAVPHQDRGVVEVLAWWPDAPALQVLRVHPDGSRHPVRGGYGVLVGDPTRHNWAQNPSLEVGLNGYVPDAGSPTLSRVTETTVPDIPRGTYALRATIASAGFNGVTVPVGLTGPLPVSVAFDAHFVVRPTGVRVVVSWADSGGGALATNTVNIPADAINTAVGQWGRLYATLVPPVGAVTPTVKIIADGMGAGSAMDLDGIVVEQGVTSAEWFDGNSLGASWDGVVGLSASRLAPVIAIADGECPLDVPVAYIVTNPAITGGQVTSGTVALPAYRRWCWLTHPLGTANPIKVDLRSVPVLEHGVDQGIFYPIMATRATVVSAPRREPSTQITFNASSFAERDALMDLFRDGQPVLLRAPAKYGYGEGTWWALGAITEDRETRLAHHDAMILTAPAVSVEPPPAELVFAAA